MEDMPKDTEVHGGGVDGVHSVTEFGDGGETHGGIVRGGNDGNRAMAEAPVVIGTEDRWAESHSNRNERQSHWNARPVNARS